MPMQTVLLKVIQGHLRGNTFLLQPGDNIIGEEGTIRLDSATIAEQHANINISSDRVLLSDLGSSSGTMLNDRFIVDAEILHDGDLICIGSYTLRVRISSPRGKTSWTWLIIAGLLSFLVGSAMASAYVVFSTSAYKQQQAEISFTPIEPQQNNNWDLWSSNLLPTQKELAELNIEITPESALTMYNHAVVWSKEAHNFPEIAAATIMYYKICLGIYSALPNQSEVYFPVNQAFTHLSAIQNQLLRYIDSAYRAAVLYIRRNDYVQAGAELEKILQWSPRPGCQYRNWAVSVWPKIIPNRIPQLD